MQDQTSDEIGQVATFPSDRRRQLGQTIGNMQETLPVMSLQSDLCENPVDTNPDMQSSENVKDAKSFVPNDVDVTVLVDEDEEPNMIKTENSEMRSNENIIDAKCFELTDASYGNFCIFKDL